MKYEVYIQYLGYGNPYKWSCNKFNGGTLTKVNPGSVMAMIIGCTCPSIDNGGGNEEIGKIRGFYISQDCPVHDPKASAE